MGDFSAHNSRLWSRDGPTDWVVVIEAMAGPGDAPFEFESVRQMVALLGDWHATGLYCADRYAVQMDAAADACWDALRWAMAAHRQAAHDVGMTPALFLRAEVLAPETLQGDLQGATSASDAPVDGSVVATRVYEATRAVLRATSVAQVRSAVADFVAYAGGSVLLGPRPPQAGKVTADLGLGPDEQIFASAEALSVGGMLIEASLPTLVDDARRACQRLRRQRDPR